MVPHSFQFFWQHVRFLYAFGSLNTAQTFTFHHLCCSQKWSGHEIQQNGIIIIFYININFNHVLKAQQSFKIRVDLSAWGSSFNWKNRLEELDLSHTTSLSFCVFLRKCVHVHICRRVVLFHPFSACMFWSWWRWSVLLICGRPVVFCAWAACVWHSFPIQPHRSHPSLIPFVADVSCQQTGRLAQAGDCRAWRQRNRREGHPGISATEGYQCN